ncbi:cupin domain-containing protein [Egibacter rhizosphaerae]|uniref:cupin domain-containing protein n=1 Tax=Egibacter rhizosphaerae TaxID=1670831 RepID=UPI0013F1583B|nr:cupin domain-containing protein [Egibacter rhizosphaerae]
MGEALRALRQERGLSLAEVAKATGISPSFLSLVETGKNDITVGRLTRLVQFYDVSVLDLLPDERHEEPDVIRASEQKLLHSPAEGIDAYLMISDVDRDMLPMLLVFEPGATLAEPGRHQGEEFVHVLEGVLRLEVNGQHVRTLFPGDSAHYSAERPHLFSNARTDSRLRILCVDSASPL